MLDHVTVLDAVLGTALVTVAFAALISRDLFQATVMFIFFGLIMAIAWCRLDAVDVALAEAAIGSGLTGALLLNTLAAIRRQRSPAAMGGDCCSAESSLSRSDWPDPASRGMLPFDKGQRRTGMLLIATAGIAAVGLASVMMPLAGAPQPLGIAAANALPPSGVDNPVTAVLLNFRAYDTLLEVAVLLAAVFAVLPVTQFATGMEKTPPLGPILAMFIRLIVPPATVVATYVLWIGTKSPGGAFQAAAILAAVAVLLILGGALPPRIALRRWRLLLIMGLVVFLAAAVEGLFAERQFLQYRTEWAGFTITGIEVALTGSIALILTMLFSCTLPTSEEVS